MIDLPLGLRTAIQSGTAVLFVGAGIGYDVVDPQGDPAPDGDQLAVELAARFEIELTGAPDLAKVAQIVELRKGRRELHGFLAKRLANLEPNAQIQSLLGHRWAAIFTTNYDRVIERGYDLQSNPPQTPVIISATSELVEADPRFEVPIYHLHGSLYFGERPDILITQEDYARFGERRRMLFEVLKQRFATNPFLYVGYSQRDPNWRTLQGEMRAEFSPRRPPRSYRVAPSTDMLDAEILAAVEIETLDGTLGDLALASAGLHHADDADRLKQIEASVPMGLLDAFHVNPAATARLLSSWEYVNEAAFGAPTNIAAYLAGDLPTWSLVASGQVFERDVEEPLYDELVDFATGSAMKPESLLLLGSAGYGVSTVLMTVAARLVKEHAGPVLMHRRGTALVEGDLEFAVSVLGQRPFFLIDNAADVGHEAIAAIQRLRDLKKPACFVLGERLNEWRQHPWRLSPVEFEIEPLSDAEILRLLKYLEQHSALNALAELEPSLQFAAVKQKHEQQLLVAMRELTEGKAFDAIIEDEYRAIGSTSGQVLYAAVCALYRLRVPVRMEVLADVLEVGLGDIYDYIGPAVEGIVRVEEIDGARGISAARARHQVIAQIVWERLIEQSEKDGLLQRSVEALNLTYVLDKRAFDALVRDDRGVDGLGSLEGKVNFFEKATRKDPENPYVLQHYARMLLRENQAELALAVIDKAIAIRSSARILNHTRGLILRHMALRSESPEIARRRLTQSEAALRESFGPQRRDPYVYQALAELYLGWAQQSKDADEVADYITRAEETIHEGLVKARERDGLWLVSAKVEEFLGNAPEAFQALERAVQENPKSLVARYLLGRARFRAREWATVVELLNAVLEEDPQDYRAAVLLAKAMERSGEPYSQCVAVLRLADLYGRRDAKFIATLGGMLTMQGEFTAAEETFTASRESVTYRESTRVEYEPRMQDEPPPALHGSVVTIRSGYAFVRSPGYPDFFWPGRTFGALDVQRGVDVTFRPAFTARGGIAVEVTVAAPN